MPIVVERNDPRIVAGLAGAAGLYATSRTNTADSLQQQQMEQQMRLNQQRSDLQFADMVNRNRIQMDDQAQRAYEFDQRNALDRERLNAQIDWRNSANDIAWNRNEINAGKPTAYDTELARQAYKDQQGNEKLRAALAATEGDPELQRLILGRMSLKDAMGYDQKERQNQTTNDATKQRIEIERNRLTNAASDDDYELMKQESGRLWREAKIYHDTNMDPLTGQFRGDPVKLDAMQKAAMQASSKAAQGYEQTLLKRTNPQGPATQPTTQPSSGQLPPPDAMAGQLPVYEDPAKIDALPAGTVFVTRINGRLARVVKE